MLPIGRTVVMKYPDVTRTISFEISGKRATGRWLSALYRQRVRSTEASASGNRSARSATSNVRFTPGRLERFRVTNRARCICACAMSNPRAVMLLNPSACARMTSRLSHVPGTQPASRMPDRACAGSPQVSQFLLQYGPDAAICVRVHSVKGKWLRRIAISIRDIIVTSLVVDVSDVIRCLVINGGHRMPHTMGDGQI